MQANNLIVTGSSRFLNKIQGTAVAADEATTAARLNNTAAIGGAGTPTYFNANGVPVACTLSSIYVGRATGDESGNNIKASYASSVTVSGNKLILKNKNAGDLANVTLPDNNTTYALSKNGSSVVLTPNSGSATGIIPNYATSADTAAKYNGTAFGSLATASSVTTGQVTNFASAVQSTKVNNAGTADLGKRRIFIQGTQTTATTTGLWTGDASPYFNSADDLVDGQEITYWLPLPTTGNATLNLKFGDGTSSGAVNCYYGNTSRLTTHYGQGNAIHLTYRKNVKIPSTGSTTYTGWWADANYDSNSNTIDVLQGTYTIPVAGATAGLKQYSLFAEDANGKYSSFTTQNGTAVTKTVNRTDYFDISKIYYCSTGGNYATNANIGTSIVRWAQPLVDLRYTLNIATNALTARKPLYLKFDALSTSMGTEGRVCYKLAGSSTTDWWTQTLPAATAAADGIIYVKVSEACYDGYRADLSIKQKYFYINGIGFGEEPGFDAIRAIKSDNSIYADSATYATNAGNAASVNNQPFGSASTCASGAFLASSTKYAGSTAIGGMASVAHSTEKSLTLQINGGTSTAWNGSAAVTYNVTTGTLGIGTAGLKASGDFAAASHGIHVPATVAATNKKYLLCNNTWATITSADVTSFSNAVAGVTVNNATNASKVGGTAFGSLATVSTITSGMLPTHTHTTANITSFDSAVDARITRDKVLGVVSSGCSWTGSYAFAEGVSTTAAGAQSHTEGYKTYATAPQSHAEGGQTTASGAYSHAAGFKTLASGVNSHACGNSTTASGGENSFAAGSNTIANQTNQMVIGQYNSTVADALFIVGKGTATNARSNAMYITTAGELYASWLNGTVRSTPLSNGKFNRLVMPPYTTGSQLYPLQVEYGRTLSDSGIGTFGVLTNYNTYAVDLNIALTQQSNPYVFNATITYPTTMYSAPSFIFLIPRDKNTGVNSRVCYNNGYGIDRQPTNFPASAWAAGKTSGVHQFMAVAGSAGTAYVTVIMGWR